MKRRFNFPDLSVCQGAQIGAMVKLMEYIGTIEGDKELGKESQIVIYGAGKVGRHALEILQKAGWQEKIVCFCDNNKDMAGKRIEGIPVCGIQEGCARYPQAAYLVASMCVRQMVESLLQHGIEKIHIIRESTAE